MRANVLHPVATVLVAVAVLLGAGCLAAATARAAAYPPYPANLVVKSELRFKADLISRHMRKSPELLFYGGSRSQRFDPAFARRVTGLRAANITVSNARPEGSWAVLNWLYSRWPHARIRFVWGVSAGVVRDFDLDPALLQDPRFYRYFPDDLLKQQRALLPASVASMPKTYSFLNNRYSPLGMLLWNRYDAKFAAGYTLDEALDRYIAHLLRHKDAPAQFRRGRARSYFEATLKLLNEHGTTPIVVLMPVHPRVLAAIRQHHMGGRHEQMRRYLVALATRIHLKVVDLTRIRSFNGRAAWFYDGVHINRENANRVILTLKRVAGAALK
jgi:hypothetical protein